MQRSIYKAAFLIFWCTLILYLLTLASASYVGVYLTYVAIPVIVFSGLLAYWVEPKDSAPKVDKTPQDRILEIEARLKELEDQ